MQEKGVMNNSLRSVNSRKKILKNAANASVNQCRMYGSAYPDAEAAVAQWLKQAQIRNLPVSSPLLIKKAQCFTLHLKHDDFIRSSPQLPVST